MENLISVLKHTDVLLKHSASLCMFSQTLPPFDISAFFLILLHKGQTGTD